MKKSKTIQNWCDKNSDIIDQYVFNPNEEIPHWIWFNEGYYHTDLETSSISESHVETVMKYLKRKYIVTEEEFFEFKDNQLEEYYEQKRKQ